MFGIKTADDSCDSFAVVDLIKKFSNCFGEMPLCTVYVIKVCDPHSLRTRIADTIVKKLHSPIISTLMCGP